MLYIYMLNTLYTLYIHLYHIYHIYLYMLYTCTVINLLFVNYFSDKHKSTLVAHNPKSGRFVTSQFNVLHSTMLPIATE